jgi:hypothetical protein
MGMQRVLCSGGGVPGVSIPSRKKQRAREQQAVRAEDLDERREKQRSPFSGGIQPEGAKQF